MSMIDHKYNIIFFVLTSNNIFNSLMVTVEMKLKVTLHIRTFFRKGIKLEVNVIYKVNVQNV